MTPPKEKKATADVAIIGGGPAGSTLGSLLKTYRPDLDVVILEREQFPRDHVGESLLPAACTIMDEIGVWDEVERHQFPIKVGAHYRWGATPELIEFNFLRSAEFERYERPAPFTGQRQLTTFQVDRSIFDKILLDHSRELGCRVYENTKVVKVHNEGDRVTGLETDSETIEARYYIDASGVSGILRRQFEVGIQSPTTLRNIAIWDYWQDASWAHKVGEGGTFIQVMSLGWGWIWFITIGNTRTSVGLVTPVEYFKQSGLDREEIYLKALAEEPHIVELLKNAKREHKLHADRDWSYISDRLSGENWFLAGDSCGFADPILSAGISLAMSGSRRVAYSILELERGTHDPVWIREEYDRIHKLNIGNHIRFADYWYSANAKFSDLEEYCSEIAKGAGLSLDAKEAFRWLGTGGFTDDLTAEGPSSGSYRLNDLKRTIQATSGENPEWEIGNFNHLTLNLEGATRQRSAAYRDGQVKPVESYRRGDHTLLLERFYKYAYMAISKSPWISTIIKDIKTMARRHSNLDDREMELVIFEILEAMLVEGWIEGAAITAPT